MFLNLPQFCIKLLAGLALIYGVQGLGQDKSPLVLHSMTYSGLSVSQHLHHYYDRSGDLRLDDIRHMLGDFVAPGLSQASHPTGAGTFWAFLDVVNPYTVPIEIYLLNNIYLALTTDVYFQGSQGYYQTFSRNYKLRYFGNSEPFRLAYVPLVIPPGQHRIFVSQRSIVFNRFDLKIFDPLSFRVMERQFEIIIIMIFGMIIILVFIEGIEWAYRPNLAKFFYCTSLISLSSSIIILNGFWRYYLPNPEFLFENLVGILATLTIILTISPIEFSIAYLKLEASNRNLVRIVRGISLVILFLFIPLCFINITRALSLAFPVTICGYTLSTLLSFWHARYSLPARFLAGGWVVIIFSIGVSLGSTFQILPDTFLFRTAILWSLPFQYLTFHFGLSRLSSDELQQTQDRITILNLQLKQRIQLLRKLAAGVAHEINNPMGIILGNLEIISRLIKKSSLAEKIEPRLTKTVSTISRVSKITEQLLIFSQEKVNYEMSKVDINIVLRHVLITFYQRFDRLKINFDVQNSEENPIIAHTNPLALAEVLAKVIDNACEAVEQVEKPAITFYAKEASPDWVDILICDNGEGIDPSIQDHIFDPFITTKAAKKSPGLGLSTAAATLATIDGELSVADKQLIPGFTTCFLIRIPAKSRPLSQDQIQREADNAIKKT